MNRDYAHGSLRSTCKEHAGDLYFKPYLFSRPVRSDDRSRGAHIAASSLSPSAKGLEGRPHMPKGFVELRMRFLGAIRVHFHR